MGLDRQFNTIVYHSDTGVIEEILPNKYIRSREKLNLALKTSKTTNLKFFYVHGGTRLRKEELKVIIGSKNRCPRLVSLSGTSIELIIAEKEAIYKLETNKGLEYTFEGGMGDYMDQANVIIEMQKKYPDKIFKVIIEHENRKKALEMLEGWKKSFWRADRQSKV